MKAIVGPPRSGKTSALRAAAGGESILAHPSALVEIALKILAASGQNVALIDDVEAETIFARCARDLVSLEWQELLAGTIDPEVPGLRSPERFLESAFRLVRKLGDGAVSPESFLSSSLLGGTQFYAKPPNFAHPELILGTKDAYRNSLDVDNAELQRQYNREIDLAKILEKLYATYERCIRAEGRMPARDVVLAAIDALRASPDLAATFRKIYAHLYIDEAQEATPAMRTLLEALYGEHLEGVTVAGDASSATNTFRGARIEALLSGAAQTEQLTSHRPRIEVNAIRAKTQEAEAQEIASAVKARLDAGTPPSQIALIFRSVGDVHAYEEALIDANVPAAISGDVNIFADRRALDALALLWNVWDPYRHDYLLRTLQSPAVGLSDAGLATLCSEPPDAQTPLFEVALEPPPTSRKNRFDPRRDLRLGWNVVRGSNDAALSELARKRLLAFRETRRRWLESLATQPLPDFIGKVWAEGLARDGAPGCARALSQQLVLRRLFDRLIAFANAHPEMSLGDALNYAQARAETTLEACEAVHDERFINILDIDSARGRSFDFVVIPDARAGSFPRWYVPDSFLFSPRLGMIPKENVGDASASRTAKFTYYMHRAKINKAYNDEERRAFDYAISRANGAVLVTASGKATRGITAPEFLEELRQR